MADVKRENRIIVVEDARGIADGYRTILENAGYSVTVFTRLTLDDLQKFADQGSSFDLAIVDIVLPAEKKTGLRLEDCQYTGIRLMERMVELGICKRFYVITVRVSLKSGVERLCEEKQAAIKFQYKLDYEPEKLLPNVADLLATTINE